MTLPCIVCGRALRSAAGPAAPENQPHGATVFTSPGHYGSTVWDMESGFLEVSICDRCLVERRDRVLHGEHPRRPEPVYEPWNPVRHWDDDRSDLRDDSERLRELLDRLKELHGEPGPDAVAWAEGLDLP